MAKVTVIGAAGRMGRRLVTNILSTPGMSLAGAVEYPASEFLGCDAASVAGLSACGVKITASLEEALENADAVIDFSTGTVMENAELAASKGCRIVIGTTALGPDAPAKFEEIAKKHQVGIVFASNYSVGVNLLFYLSKKVAGILKDYDVEIIEAHHNQKKDAPSGTAVTIAERICEARGLSYEKDVVHGRNGLVGARTKTEIGMHSVRGGDIVGDHTVMFATTGERFEMTHKASSRDTFARGAVRAVAFLETAKPGLYNMQDVLGLN